MGENHQEQASHPASGEAAGQKRPRIKRRKILVDKKFQLQYLYIWLFTAIGMIAVTLGFYLVASRYIDMETSEWILRLMTGTGIFILLFTFLMGTISVVLTHRVAGAVFRIDGFIKKVIKDDYSDFIKLRKSDYLHNIADSLNELNRKFSSRWEKLGKLSEKTDELKSGIKEDGSGNNKLAATVSDIEGIIQEIQQV